MTELIDRSQRLSFRCDECGTELQESIARLETNPELTCTGCQSVVHINADDLRIKLIEAERDIQRFIDAIPKKIEVKLKF